MLCRDSVNVNYAVISTFEANTSDTVLLKACYSPFSRVNRPWRALNNVIAVRFFFLTLQETPLRMHAGVQHTSMCMCLMSPTLSVQCGQQCKHWTIAPTRQCLRICLVGCVRLTCILTTSCMWPISPDLQVYLYMQSEIGMFRCRSLKHVHTRLVLSSTHLLATRPGRFLILFQLEHTLFGRWCTPRMRLILLVPAISLSLLVTQRASLRWACNVPACAYWVLACQTSDKILLEAHRLTLPGNCSLIPL